MSPTEWGFAVDADNGTAFNYLGILKGLHTNAMEVGLVSKVVDTQRHGMPLALDTFFQSSYNSNERESRPKTKFFSLMIYAGYPA